MSRPVLIVEDDPDIAEGLRYNLEREQLETRVALTGEEGLAAALDAGNPPTLIVLDLMLPGMSGFELCRRLRREPATCRTPIIMVTARTARAEVEAGFDLGADDYFTKPFSVRDLVARVRALLQSAAQRPETLHQDGSLQIDFAEGRVTCNGAFVELPRREFTLLSVLLMNDGRTVTRRQLLNNVWGNEGEATSHALEEDIGRLRRRLGVCGGAIKAVGGVGYRFVRPPNRRPSENCDA